MNKERIYFFASGLILGLVIGTVVTHQLARKEPVERAGAEQSAPRPGGGPPQATVDELIETHLAVIKEAPDNINLMKTLGNLYQDKGDWTNAIVWYRRFMEKSPSNVDVLTDLGTCYWSIGEKEKALELFKRAIEIDPDHWQSHFNTAIVEFFSNQDRTRALEALEEVERIKPGHPAAQRLKKPIASGSATANGTT